MLTGTVLFVKNHPTDEISVKLNGRPVVISLRNVNLFTPESVQSQLVESGTNSSQLRTVRDICEGMSLVLYDIGIWNTHTTAFHHASVYLDKDVDHLKGNNAFGSESSQGVTRIDAPIIMGSAVLPKRRKHSAMSLA
jgi:hypothetical protein